MKNSNNRHGLGTSILLPISSLMLVLFLLAGTAVAATKTKNSPKKNAIHITSDKLVSSQSTHTDFIGNVKTIYENYTLTSDKLRVVFFSKEEKASRKETPGGNIKTIIATGHVIILFDDKKAMSEKAEYYTDKDLIILSGDNSRIITGENSLSGKRIEINTKTNAIKAESGSTGRVEVIFYSENKDKK